LQIVAEKKIVHRERGRKLNWREKMDGEGGTASIVSGIEGPGYW